MLANLPLLLLLTLALAAHAKHWTCSWGGPGNNPEKGGYYLFCTGKIVNETTYDASYECPGDDGIPFEVATFGKLPHEDGIIEFKTPCNTNGFGSVNSCSPATWGLCLGEKSSKTGDYNKCLYMQYYDDCEWPDVIRDNEKPAKVSIYRKTYKIAEEATVTREVRAVAEGGKRRWDPAG